MKKAIKFSMAFILMVTAILVIPKVSNAETREVTDESSLISEISSANPGDININTRQYYNNTTNSNSKRTYNRW